MPPLRGLLLSLSLAALLGLVGCAGGEQLSDEDHRVIAELSHIAARDAGIGESAGGDPAADDATTNDVSTSDAAVGGSANALTGVECWQPSSNLIDERQFRVLCRVHYTQQGDGRYRDMICIGEAAREPVTDYCYQWAPYSDMPEFEDQPGHFAA